MSITTNAPAVALRYRQAAAAVRSELAGELRNQAGRVESMMKREAPKYLSTIANSVRVDQLGPHELLVAPHTDYAKWVHAGRKPGKGLPRFFDPASASIVAWLDDKLAGTRRATSPGYRRGRIGTARRTAEELELRDRYWMLSRAIKARGIKPNPFVKRTADAFRTAVPDALAVAVKRGLQQARGGVA